MNYIENARRLRPVMEQAAQLLDEQAASTVPEMHGTLKGSGALIAAGTRINWKGTVMRAAVDLWDTAENTPDKAPDLWAGLNYREGHRIIPETITVSMAFAEGELGWWGDVLYRSRVASNVYTPAQYPDNWEIAEG